VDFKWRHDTQHNDSDDNDTQHNGLVGCTQYKRHLTEEESASSIILLSVAKLSVAFFIVILSVAMLNAVMLNVFILNVIYAECSCMKRLVVTSRSSLIQMIIYKYTKHYNYLQA
jgi:hypothetical protein